MEPSGHFESEPPLRNSCPVAPKKKRRLAANPIEKENEDAWDRPPPSSKERKHIVRRGAVDDDIVWLERVDNRSLVPAEISVTAGTEQRLAALPLRSVRELQSRCRPDRSDVREGVAVSIVEEQRAALEIEVERVHLKAAILDSRLQPRELEQVRQRRL